MTFTTGGGGLRAPFNTKQQINPFSFLLIIRIQEGLLSARCPVRIVSAGPLYENQLQRTRQR